MPNNKGGKNYKKSKNITDEPVIYEVLPGQMYGRVIKLVGGCNAVVYCNDNKERICHIRGNMRRKVWIDTGDIVLISLRDLDNSDITMNSNIDRGDICAKYDSRVIQRLQQKDSTINPKLFLNIEKTDGTRLKSGNVPVEQEDSGFTFEVRDNVVLEDEDSSDSEKPLPVNRSAQKRAMMEINEDDFNIDDI